ncbi:GntR family transcriptional regulator [Plantactinospora endophytica]|uniref:GntR family transcriptional regulator n=1 Tax=Plantactinospora endophytica TaxID=673535 RepID=A0ABQ4E3N4_9ACTN|nr:GntR family transcriptional regulator [Plantactinospora endophytica]GIG89307.1 GntR family transcriptional regulator [Plantactinospora endophytica]
MLRAGKIDRGTPAAGDEQPPPAAGQQATTTPRRRAASSADEAYEELRQAIHRGDLMPNERLIEVELASRLQVSRGVVRTALVRLGQDGLVVLTPNRGAHVRLVSEEEAVEILQVRAVLEALTARQAASNATAREVTEIRAVLDRMAQRLDSDDLLGYSEGNANLHAAIIAAARHDTAAKLIAGLRGQLVRFQYRTILVPGRAAQSLDEHAAIVEAIAARDPDAAEVAMRRHLGHVESTLADTATAIRHRADPSDGTHPA